MNLKDWFSQWLESSGVNIIEPVIEKDQDGLITKLSVKQTCDLKGKNRLRMQLIDIGLFDEELESVIIRNISLSD